MQRPSFRFSIRAMLIGVLIVGIGLWGVLQYESYGIYYARGWLEAQQEIQQGAATIYDGGGFLAHDWCKIDRETGLPIKMIHGCVITDALRARKQGHNDHIAEYIRRLGMPQNSLKRWEDELFHLKQCFEEGARTNPLQRVVAGGSALIVPGGKSQVRLVATPLASEGAQLEIAAGTAVLGSVYAPFGAAGVEVLWSPREAPFAVIRSTRDRSEWYAAVDTRTCRQLRVERWHEGKPTDHELVSAEDY